jgi:hypothetical protein
MSFRLNIFSFVFLTSVYVQAQDNSMNNTEMDYSNFKTTLIKETNSYAKDILVQPRNTLHPVNIPDWFADFSLANDQCLYAFGISDPGMEKDTAFQLAMLRAKSLIALMVHPVVASLTDNFAKEKSDDRSDEFTTKYENLYRIDSSIEAPEEAFEIADSCFNSFGEAIVLLKYHLNFINHAEIEHISITIDAYQVERQKHNQFETQERLSMTVSACSLMDTSHKETFSYSCISYNNLYEIESQINNREIKVPYFYYRYAVKNDSTTIGDENNGSEKLSYGLWKALAEQVVQKIILLSQPFAANIKQVGDQYSTENKSLSREISEAHPSFKLINLNISNNYLAVDMDYLNNQQ